MSGQTLIDRGVAIGRVLSTPFGFDLTSSAPPRTVGMGFSIKL
ncbi:MAG TPA: hypothetical protein VFO35_02640 [Steroidobacteraceae bacterium]|nr:hypothetical protein [Steroidobacteraceae bacterium]